MCVQMSVLGWVERAEVDRLLMESDALVLPSRAEGMAMSLVEGMSWGLAVIATAVGAHEEFLQSGTNSIVVSPGDVGGISKAMYKLATNPALRLRLGLAGRETAKGFCIDEYVTKLTGMYEELAAKLPLNW